MKCDTRAFSGPRAPFTPVQRPSRTKGSRFAILLRSESPVFKFLPLLECSHKTPTDTAMVQEHCHHGNPSPGDTFNDFLTVQHCPSAWSQRGGFPPFLLTPNTPLDNMDSPSQDTHTHTHTHTQTHRHTDCSQMHLKDKGNVTGARIPEVLEWGVGGGGVGGGAVWTTTFHPQHVGGGGSLLPTKGLCLRLS